MAALEKKPNGGNHCERCGRLHVVRDSCDVRYDAIIKKWLCNTCWADTPNPARPKPS
jgi:hypothetical protein